MWFEKLTGFREENPEQVRSMLLLNGEYLVSQVNGQRMRHGVLTTPNLLELRVNTNQTSSHSEAEPLETEWTGSLTPSKGHSTCSAVTIST